MHSMPAAAKHPSGKWLCYQSLDSQIVTYGCSGKFRQNKKKVFKGHLVGGNACQVRSLLWLSCSICLVFVLSNGDISWQVILPHGNMFKSGDSVASCFLAIPCAECGQWIVHI